MLLPVVLLAFFFKSEAVDWGCSSAEPVCGTDGKTYNDICEFNAEKLLDPDLQVLYEGICLDYKKLKGPLKLNFRNPPPFFQPINSKKYLLHFRTFARDPNANSILDDCPQKCKSLCPQNHDDFRSTLYFTKLCLDCCRGW